MSSLPRIVHELITKALFCGFLKLAPGPGSVAATMKGHMDRLKRPLLSGMQNLDDLNVVLRTSPPGPSHAT